MNSKIDHEKVQIWNDNFTSYMFWKYKIQVINVGVKKLFTKENRNDNPKKITNVMF